MQANDILKRLDEAALGVTFLGVATLAYGIACILQGDFAIYWQPVPDGIPLRTPLAYLSAALLTLSGAGLLVARTVRPAALLLLLLLSLYAVLFLFRLIGPPVEIGALSGMADQLAVVAGIWAILALRTNAEATGATGARILFGICSLVFGLAHFVGREATANMVPEWMPGGQMFWALATGVGHVAVGLGLLANRLAIPATRLGGLLYLCIVIFAWLPGALENPTQWLRWAGAAISLCVGAALWMVGDLLAVRRSTAPSAGAPRADAPARALAAD